MARLVGYPDDCCPRLGNALQGKQEAGQQVIQAVCRIDAGYHLVQRLQRAVVHPVAVVLLRAVVDIRLGTLSNGDRYQIIGEFGPRGKLLDIGCGQGFFVACMKKYGWDAAGVDVSAWAVEWGTERLGIRMFLGRYFSVRFDIRDYMLLPGFSSVENNLYLSLGLGLTFGFADEVPKDH